MTTESLSSRILHQRLKSVDARVRGGVKISRPRQVQMLSLNDLLDFRGRLVERIEPHLLIEATDRGIERSIFARDMLSLGHSSCKYMAPNYEISTKAPHWAISAEVQSAQLSATQDHEDRLHVFVDGDWGPFRKRERRIARVEKHSLVWN